MHQVYDCELVQGRVVKKYIIYVRLKIVSESYSRNVTIMLLKLGFLPLWFNDGRICTSHTILTRCTVYCSEQCQYCLWSDLNPTKQMCEY